MTFKIGDVVKVVKKGNSYASKRYFRRKGTVIKAYIDCATLDIEKSPTGFWNDELKLIKATTQYETLMRNGVI